MTTTPDGVDLDGRVSYVRAELVRVDSKAGTLLTLAGVSLTVGLAVLGRTHLPVAAAVAGWLAAAAAGTAVAMLAAAVRPGLGGDHGFVRYAELTPDDLFSQPDVCPAEQLIWLSRLARAKFVRVRYAVDALQISLAATAVSAVLAVALR